MKCLARGKLGSNQVPLFPLTLRPTYPDNMVHGVDIAVAHVDADGPQAEAVLLA